MSREIKNAFLDLKGVVRLLGSVLLVIYLVFAGASLQVQAENSQKVVDEADILDDEEEEKLQKQLTETAERYQCDVVAVTMDTIGGEDIEQFADSYFYYNGYGYGDGESGILFLVTMQERKFRLATRGDATIVFTDYGLEKMDEIVSEELSEGNYYEAFSEFGDLAEQFMKEARDDRPYDVDHTYKKPMPLGIRLLIALVAGLVVAAVVVAVLFAQLKSVGTEREAWEYVRSGSFHLTRQRDIFLYRNITRRKIEHEDHSGGGGGSTTHSSPGGGRSGGRTGSF